MDNFDYSKLKMNEVRRSNYFKVRHATDWTLKDVIEKVGGKDYEEVKANELKKT